MYLGSTRAGAVASQVLRYEVGSEASHRGVPAKPSVSCVDLDRSRSTDAREGRS